MILNKWPTMIKNKTKYLDLLNRNFYNSPEK
jgi:hypothetical protein